MESANLPIKLLASNLRPLAYRILSKKHGLNIKTDALLVLTEIISYKFGFDWRGPKSLQYLEDIAKIWKIEDRGVFIDGPGLKQVAKELNKTDTKGDGVEKARRSDTIVDMEEQEVEWQDYFKIVNPPEQPHFKFDKQRKQFGLVPLSKENTLSERLARNLASSVELFSNRYFLLLDRLSRNENFKKTSFASISSISSMLSGSVSNEITLIKNVLGRDGQKFILFGLLSKNTNGDFILEDSSDYIEVNFVQTFKTEGSFYGPGMFVIVEGIYSASGHSSSVSNDYIGGCFHVSNIGHPPAERRDASNENYGNIDFLGIHKEEPGKPSEKVLKINKTWKKKLTIVEKSLTNHKFIMLGSNCYLDSFKVIEGLKKLFGKIEASLTEEKENDDVPLAIVMVGSFSSQPFTPTNSSISSISNSETYKGLFDNLSSIIAQYPTMLRLCKFVLIPGKNDPWQSSYSLGGSSLDYFPQRSIPHVFTSRLERIFPKGNLILGWNPVRINYLTQEIVILKDDLMTKFRRNDITFANDLEKEAEKLARDRKDEEDRIKEIVHDTLGQFVSPRTKQARKLVKTVLDQGNLQPFLKDYKLVDVTYDHALRIEPLPNVLVLHDAGFENFEVTYNGCKVVNISELISSNSRKLNYAEYYPSAKNFEFQSVYF